jgi:SulP family sulfate permease
VLTQGAPPDGMILLLSGRLRAEFAAPGGAALPVATILPGTLVGEIGHYAGVPRTARVVAETPCRLLRLDACSLDALAAAEPQVAADLHRLAAANLAHRLMRTTALLRDADL